MNVRVESSRSTSVPLIWLELEGGVHFEIGWGHHFCSTLWYFSEILLQAAIKRDKNTSRDHVLQLYYQAEIIPTETVYF